MSSWSEERRLNAAADAEQRRKDKVADDERRAKLREVEDQRRRANRIADQAEQRAEQQQRRRDGRDRRRERAQAWAKHTAPGVLFQRGVLALVTASALASLPAQIIHFAAISLMLLPIPFALEGAAWVMAAGVAHADEKGLPAWVRWLLRGLCVSAAGFAAWINYGYGSAIAPAAGYGLAAVTLLGPLVFEVRQWVSTLTVKSSKGPSRAELKAKRKHDRKRNRHHKGVVRIARKLVTAAPYGSLPFEDAFRSAWEIVNGTKVPGMTPALHAQEARSRKALADSLTATGMTPEAVAVEVFLAETFGPGSGDDGGDPGTASGGRQPGPRGGSGGGALGSRAKPSQGPTALGRKGKRASGRTSAKTPLKPLDAAHLEQVRKLADALGSASKLSARNVGEVVGGGSIEYLVRLRTAVQSERAQ